MRIVRALFHDPAVSADDAYVQRRYDSSVAPGAWESVAAARFRRPGHRSSAEQPSPRTREIAVPTLVVEGAFDKLKPHGLGDRDRRPDPRCALGGRARCRRTAHSSNSRTARLT